MKNGISDESEMPEMNRKCPSNGLLTCGKHSESLWRSVFNFEKEEGAIREKRTLLPSKYIIAEPRFGDRS